MAARIAASLATLRDQINNAYPKRSKVSDGWIGDTAHASRPSDHNPNSAGVVQALDLTHDPVTGPDTWKLADILRQNKDPRIKYVISNGRIFSSKTSPWVWRPYTGANKHAHHVHVSVNDDPALYDSKYLWKIDAGLSTQPAPLPPVVAPPPGITKSMRHRMARKIIDYEARRSPAGNLMVFRPADGSFEVGGLNSAHHPTDASKLRSLVDAGKFAEADEFLERWILDYTAVADGWVEDAGLEFYLRDCVYNRGPSGAAKILQMALGVNADGEIGQQSRAAISREKPNTLLTRLRAERERYERLVMKRNESSPVWKGLVNRWNNSLADAQAFQKEGGKVGGAGTATVGAVVVGGGIAAAKSAGFDWGVIIPIAVIAIAGVVAAVFIARSRR